MSVMQCGGNGKANCVVIGEDGTREVMDWQLGNHHVPAVHRVRATLVRFPVNYYVHADYGPEVMAARSKPIAELGWSSRSFDLPLPPETVGHFNLLTHAVSAAHRELDRAQTLIRVGYPSVIVINSPDASLSGFNIYLNLAACEFYHMLWVIAGASGHPPSQIICEPADVSTCPKLMRWLTRFEAAKRKLYRKNGFDWNPTRGPINDEPTN